ncbi:hypothetical protein [Rhodococcus erythropolis]|uniref:hypothetical protein n=1 Tax=Rhodococcus erythropolis TaxID=1833 RepID=UPI003671BD37
MKWFEKKTGEPASTPTLVKLLGLLSFFVMVASAWVLIQAVDWLGVSQTHRRPGTSPFKGERKTSGFGERLAVMFGFDTDLTVVTSQPLLWVTRLGCVVTVVLIVLTVRIAGSVRNSNGND